MSTIELINAVKAQDRKAVEGILASGVNVNEAGDEQGWTALCVAAGRGDRELVRLLIEKGADVFKTGRDQRTPYKIAVAAGHVETAKALASAEVRAGGDKDGVSSLQGKKRSYCKAYPADSLGPFLQLQEGAVVFVHQDLSVTKSIWHDKEVLLDGTDPTWRDFCVNQLGFRVPEDYDLITPSGR